MAQVRLVLRPTPGTYDLIIVDEAHRGYLVGTPVTYDPVLTIMSLIIAIGGTNLGLFIAALDRPRASPAVGGAVIGMAVTAMHYVGMLAYRVGGAVRWQPEMVVASGVLAIILGALAMSAARQRLGLHMVRWGAPLLIAAVLSLHFTGMAALHVTPLIHSRQGFGAGTIALAVGSATLGLLVTIAGCFAHFIDDKTQGDSLARIKSISLTDAQTSLPNQAGLEAELAARLKAAPDASFMMATLKLNNLGAEIERYGKHIGELALHSVIARMQEAKGTGVFLARTGRAEISALGPASDIQELRSRAERIVTVLALPLLLEFNELLLDPRIGVACYPADTTRIEDLIPCSRRALTRALNHPLEPVGFYDEWQDTAARRRHTLASDLRSALDRGQFELFYQPQVWSEDRSVIGYEALLRWRHPELGMISPGEFISLAEKTGDILSIGDWALRTACAAATDWPKNWRVAVNVSPLQLRQPDLPLRVWDGNLLAARYDFVPAISWARRAHYLPIYCRFYRIFGMIRNRSNPARPPVTGAEVLLNQ